MPKPVIKTYNNKIADTIDATWEKNEGVYTAEFVRNKRKAIALITESGEWICTQWDIPVGYISKKVNHITPMT